MTTLEPFSIFLINELPYHMSRDQGSVQHVFELSKEWENVIEEGKKVMTKLKETGQYFYEGGGSIFMDYKFLRKMTVPEGGMRKIAQRFRFDMSSTEIISQATEVVNEWRSSVDKERKG